MTTPDYKGPGRKRTAEREAAKDAAWDPSRPFDEQFDDAVARDVDDHSPELEVPENEA